jgi:hypothetical protein
LSQAFARLVAGGLGDDRFSLLDVGCSGGIDPRWRAFGPRLRAIGIDASLAECERLRKAESSPDIEYVAAFVAGRADKKIDPTRSQASDLILAIRQRLSFWRTLELREARLAKAEIEEKLRHNAWELTQLADAGKPAVVPDLLATRGWNDVDYLKIDIDGSDWEVLQSFRGKLASLGTIAVQLEVNFVGTDAPTEHAFHNTDRFMRAEGYELFRLDVRTYSSRSLPARYVWPTPAETVTGRPWQGEAYYARDGARMPDLAPPKRAKLAAIFSLWGVPDLAAEVLVGDRAALARLFDVDKGLDLLAAQTQPDGARKLSYRDYMQAFEADASWFYRREGHVGLPERLAAAWRAYRNPRA